MMNRIRVIFFSILVFIFTSCREKSLFRQLSPDETGIRFSNTIQETDSINVLDFENVYNGGGVGVGDFNRDGLQDLFFTGNLVSSKLYLNRGKFKFDDVTNSAGVGGNGRWCRGVSVVDINNDGWPDLYISVTASRSTANRQNLLYINQGNDSNGVPHFREMAAEYGLNDTTFSTMAAFFDYDNDGDLDVYIAVNDITKGDYPNRFRKRLVNGEHPNTDRLYRNDWSDSLQHPVFTNVSRQAGVLIEGYAHSINIVDINRDGWKDIYVTNDYLSQNILYINNHDGTFTDKVSEYFKHTSANAMGNDVVDINNDGLADVIELDMNPEDNYRKKMMLNANSYQTFQNSDYFGYQYQYVRNTLQLNRGPRVKQEDSVGDPIFSDIAFFAGVAETDWSWTPLVCDFDNDGYRDIVITNGFPKDVTDHDFVAFRNESFSIASKQQLLEQIPAVKIHNYAYRNNGNLRFSDVTRSWGMMTPTFSNGAVYADLDNDGDMDIVINNINDPALVYENRERQQNQESGHYLRVSLKGDTLNKNGFGALVELYRQGLWQVYEASPYRGYLSTMQMDPQFGLGNAGLLDSVLIKWPNGKKQVFKQVKADQLLEADIRNASDSYNWNSPSLDSFALFREITDSVQVNYTSEERDFIDFNIQKLLPHKFSEDGPAMAAGDLNGDGLDDFICGGSFGHSAMMFLQKPDGKFEQRPVIPNASDINKRWEDEGIALFDADGDHDLDMYIASGGYENPPNSEPYADKFYINDGKGNFTIDTTVIPRNTTSKSCVRAADFDHDGDMDLLIAGHVVPWQYPRPVSCFIYRNDSEKGKPLFTDITKSVAPCLDSIGVVNDAVWTDFDQDGWPDIVLAGDFMPVTFIRNNHGKFENVTAGTGVSNVLGWWRSILPGDFDNDGDIDYVVGNMGLNSYYRASDKYPVHMYAKDFDKNESYDAIPTLYLPATLDNPERYEFPAHTRDDLVKQMIGFRNKFRNYKSCASTPFSRMFGTEELKGALVFTANNFSHGLLRNEGTGKFSFIPLPSEAQFSCINGMVMEDVNGDGNPDIVVSGNDYGTEVSVGRYDACNGLVLAGDGKGGFHTLSILQSGLFIPGNGKALIKLRNGRGGILLAASQNRGKVCVYAANLNERTVPVNDNEVNALLKFPNGKIRLLEIPFGSSYLSQSAHFITVPAGAISCEITNNRGIKRAINF